MSRSGYSDNYEYIALYTRTVNNAFRGKRGQAFLLELAKAMDAMPERRLIAGELIGETGEVCAIGSYCKAKGIDVDAIDYDDPEAVGNLVGVARCMAAEIEYMNDEDGPENETPEQRWIRMRKWIQKTIDTGFAR